MSPPLGVKPVDPGTVRTVREALGLTPEQMEGFVYISGMTIRRLEMGLNKPGTWPTVAFSLLAWLCARTTPRTVYLQLVTARDPVEWVEKAILLKRTILDAEARNPEKVE